MIESLSHITFIVRDLDRMKDFLTKIFGAKEIYSSGSSTFSVAAERFFLIGGLWIAVMEGVPSSEKTDDHVAFKIAEADLDAYADRIRELGVEVLESRSRVEGEGRSLYFYDYDHHLFELHTGTLEKRLERYNRTGKVIQGETNN